MLGIYSGHIFGEYMRGNMFGEYIRGIYSGNIFGEYVRGSVKTREGGEGGRE